MSETRYHFWRVHPGLQPKWWSTRRNESGTLHQFIADLRKKYEVTRRANDFFIRDKA